MRELFEWFSNPRLTRGMALRTERVPMDGYLKTTDGSLAESSLEVSRLAKEPPTRTHERPELPLPVNGSGKEAAPRLRAVDELLGVLDWAGFSGAITYTFDDSNSSQLENFDSLMAMNVPLSFYLWTEKEESKSKLWAEALALGHELGNHSHHHRSDDALIEEDIDRATRFITERFGVEVWTMAAPFGSRRYAAAAKQRFFINRGVQEGHVLPLDDCDCHDLRCFVPGAGAAAHHYNQKADAAVVDGAWQIILVHGFEGGSDSAYQPVALQDFIDAVSYAKEQDLWIGTLADVGAYWLGQKALASARVKRETNGLSYSWDLPPTFPPGKKVRVVVASGYQPHQKGGLLRCHPAGFYEVDLDARQLLVEERC